MQTTVGLALATVLMDTIGDILEREYPSTLNFNETIEYEEGYLTGFAKGNSQEVLYAFDDDSWGEPHNMDTLPLYVLKRIETIINEEDYFLN